MEELKSETSEVVGEIVETELETPNPSAEVEDDIIDKSIQSGKPKKVRTQKQIEAFDKARKTRAENVKKRAEEKKINTKPVGRPKKKEIVVKPAEEIVEPIDESSSSEEEIIYKKKPKKVTKKKRKPKKKIVYISESSSSEEETSSSEEEEEVIVKQLTKPKKSKKVYYEEEQQYSYKAPSLTDFYRVM